MGRVFFTGDQHFFHKNVIEYCNRPFKNINQMHSEIIANHNNTVSPDDTCYHLGDLAFIGKAQVQKLESIISKLNGTNILIMGNHDDNHPFTYMNMGFWSVHTGLILPDHHLFKLAHDPAASIMDRSRYWIHAHLHTMYRFLNNCVNVGVDMWDYTPVSLEIIKDSFNMKTPYVYMDG